MASPEMEFRIGNTDVKMYENIAGESEIVKTFTDREGVILVGKVLGREYAAYLFGREVQRLIRQWEAGI